MQSRSLGPIVAGLGGAVYTRFMSVVAPVVGNSKYRNLLQLGEGATANVYLAVAHGPSGFNKLVVMKTLKQALVEDLTYRQMFLQEARLAARLNHPNIVQTNEVTEEGPAPSIVMEFPRRSGLLIHPLEGATSRAARPVVADHLGCPGRAALRA